jgi:ATP-dependent helicase/nuclease subunit B
VDGAPFTLTGRIDRIDRHPDAGCRILDYKTGDQPRRPDEVHRRGPRRAKEWQDLQLPLYRLLVGSLCGSDPVQLGFVNLSRELDGVGLFTADWSEAVLSEAEECAREVVRLVRRGVFWPPAEPPRHDDGFARLCGDALVDRHRLIQRSTPGAVRE